MLEMRDEDDTTLILEQLNEDGFPALLMPSQSRAFY